MNLTLFYPKVETQTEFLLHWLFLLMHVQNRALTKRESQKTFP